MTIERKHIIAFKLVGNPAEHEVERRAKDNLFQITQLLKLFSGAFILLLILHLSLSQILFASPETNKATVEFRKSLTYYKNALGIYRQTNDTPGIASTYNNIGIIHKKLGRKEAALNNYYKSLALFRKINDNISVANVLSNIGSLYLEQGNAEKISAIENDTSSTIRLNIKPSEGISAYVGENKSIIDNNSDRRKKSEIQWAENFLSQSLDIALKEKNKELIRDNYALFAELYSSIGDADNARRFYKLYDKLKDSLYEDKTRKKYSELQNKYEAEKRNKEIESYLKEAAMKSLEEVKLQNLVYIMAAFSLMVLILASVFYGGWMLKKKTNSILEAKNIDLSTINHKLIEQETILRESNLEKLKFFSIIARDLRNPINELMGLSQFLTGRFHTLDKEMIEDSVKDLNTSARRLFNLLENLLRWSESQIGLMKFYKEKIELIDLIDHNLFVFKVLADRKNINLISNVESGIFIFADMETSLDILKNLMSNAIKFTDEGGTVLISASTINDYIEVTVSDTGIGIADDEIKQLFNLDTEVSILGRSKEKGSGLGLILCKEFAEKNGGRISIKSTEGRGTQVTVTFLNADKMAEQETPFSKN